MKAKLLWLATMLCVTASASTAQTITDTAAQVRALTPDGVDETMAAMAQQVTLAAPITADKVTTFERAIYLRQSKLFNYVVKMTESIPPETVAKNTLAFVCSGRTNIAFMDRGVTYQYSVRTPTQSFAISVKRSDCP